MTQDTTRADFEAWMRSDTTLPLDRLHDDTYKDFTVTVMWHAWRAALAQPQQAAPEFARMRETLEFIATHFSSDWPERCQSHVLAARGVLAAPAGQAAAPMCACKDRPASDCPGEWEPGCDLGNNPAHVIVHEQAPAAEAVQPRCPQCEKFKTVMIAAAEEIDAQWAHHCDAEGYGPANLMRRLEEGIPSEYGYTAGAFAKLKAENDALKAQAEAVQGPRTLLEQYDLDQSPEYRKGYEDGRLKGYEVGHRHAAEAVQPAQAVRLTDERIDALWRTACERHELTRDMVRVFARSVAEAAANNLRGE